MVGSRNAVRDSGGERSVYTSVMRGYTRRFLRKKHVLDGGFVRTGRQIRKGSKQHFSRLLGEYLNVRMLKLTCLHDYLFAEDYLTRRGDIKSSKVRSLDGPLVLDDFEYALADRKPPEKFDGLSWRLWRRVWGSRG